MSETHTLRPGDVISHAVMCAAEGLSLQRGMNFHSLQGSSVILMSRRRNAPYNDQVLENGRTLVYEGHDEPRRLDGPDPKNSDQPEFTPKGRVTQNGRFYEAAQRFKSGEGPAELVRVYEKIHQGIWVYNGTFNLVDSWKEQVGSRRVFRFKLIVCEEQESVTNEALDLDHNRLIPSAVKLEVWRRDRGRCVKCPATVNLHFDHILPYSKGGTSLDAKNIQLLCARHNLQKRDKIE